MVLNNAFKFALLKKRGGWKGSSKKSLCLLWCNFQIKLKKRKKERKESRYFFPSQINMFACDLRHDFKSKARILNHKIKIIFCNCAKIRYFYNNILILLYDGIKIAFTDVECYLSNCVSLDDSSHVVLLLYFIFLNAF